MKKISLVATALAAVLLAGCAETTTTTGTSCPECEEPETTIVGYTTFEEQLKAYGITGYTYEDPNAAVYEKETVPESEEDWDIGLSGTADTSYTAEAGGSYYTYEYMVKRLGLQYYTYYWAEVTAETEEGTPTATTLEEAAKLEDAKYVSEIFPNDNKEYYIAEYHNSICTKTIIFEDADGNLHSAVYGGMSGAIGADGVPVITCGAYNAVTPAGVLHSGKAKILIYEYNYFSNDKVGPGARNFGCRLDVELDVAATTWMGVTDPSGIQIGGTLPAGCFGARLALRVTSMHSLG